MHFSPRLKHETTEIGGPTTSELSQRILKISKVTGRGWGIQAHGPPAIYTPGFSLQSAHQI